MLARKWLHACCHTPLHQCGQSFVFIRKTCEDVRNLCATESPACHVRVLILHTGEYPCQRRSHVMVYCCVGRQHKSSVDQLKAIDSKPTGFHRALGSWRPSCQQQTPHCVSGGQSFSGVARSRCHNQNARPSPQSAIQSQTKASEVVPLNSFGRTLRRRMNRCEHRCAKRNQKKDQRDAELAHKSNTSKHTLIRSPSVPRVFDSPVDFSTDACCVGCIHKSRRAEVEKIFSFSKSLTSSFSSQTRCRCSPIF